MMGTKVCAVIAMTGPESFLSMKHISGCSPQQVKK
jgi:hypothetical protein